MSSQVKLLDGGFSNELEKRGCTLTKDPLWSARCLHTNPSAILDVHKSYLACGCDIVTTASYQASLCGFQKYLGITLDESVKLMRLSVEIAQQARKEYSDQDVLIAGSVGPYGVSLADGSEYSGNYCNTLTQEEIIEWHRPKVKCLVEAGVDLIAFETIPAMKEAQALMKLLQDFPEVKAWLSFSCQSLHQTAYGEDIGSVAKNCMMIAQTSQLVAVGVNCCPPSYVESLLHDIDKELCGFPLIAYPNSGEKWVSQTGWIDNKEKPISDYVESWIAKNATIIGGCCQTGPEDILQIREKLKKHNKIPS